MRLFHLELLVILFLSFGLVANAQKEQKIKEVENKTTLSGTVLDPLGAVIVGAKVKAINQKGETFETVTNDLGVFTLKLSFTKYEPNKEGNYEIHESVTKYQITVNYSGFIESVIKDFVVVPSTYKNMSLDIALEVGKPSLSPVKEEINIVAFE